MTAPATTRLRGDEAQLFDCHHRRLVRDTAHALGCSDELAEDAAHSAWTILLATQPRRETVYPWLRVVARHEGLRLLRRERRVLSTDVEELHDAFEHAVSLTARAAAQPDDRERALEALAAIAELPSLTRDAFALHAGGYTYAEIAKRLRLSPRTIDRRLRRARERIRRAGPA